MRAAGRLTAQALAVGLLATLAGCAPPDADERIILITFDSLRADELASWGAADGPMPAVDDLAARSVVFERAYSPAPLTFPALAGLMTGRAPSTVGVIDDFGSVLSTEHDRIAPRLLAAGWSTAVFTNAPFLDHDSGMLEGFLHAYNPAADESASQSAAHLFADALGFLDTYRKLPTFAWIHVFDTHFPYRSRNATGSSTARYVAALGDADLALGAFVDGLRARGLDDSTVLIIASDHGEGLGDAGERTHGALLTDSTLHVPIIIHEPGRTARGIGSPVSLLDLGPTIVEMAGAGALDGGELDGRSLAGLVRGDGEPDPLRPVYAETFVPVFDYGWQPVQRVAADDVVVERRPGDGDASWAWPEWPGVTPANLTPPDEAGKAAFLEAAGQVIDHLETGRLEQADDAAAGMLDRWPGAPLSRRLRAAVHRAGGDLDQAIEVLQEDPARSPDVARVRAEFLEASGRPAAEAWAVAAEAKGRPRFRLDHARALLAESRPDAALAAAQDAVAAAGQSASVLGAAGDIYLRAGRPSEAAQLLSSADRLSPGSALTFRRLAGSARALQNLDGALKLLDEARRIDGYDRLTHRDIGDVQALKGDIPAAVKSYRASLAAGTPETDALYIVAENLLRVGRMDAASEMVDDLLSRAPDHAAGHYIKARIALENEDDETAEQELMESLRAGGEQPTVYYGLARVAILRDDEDKALAYLNRVFDSDDPALRRMVRDDDMLRSPERTPELLDAVNRFLLGLPPAAGGPAS